MPPKARDDAPFCPPCESPAAGAGGKLALDFKCVRCGLKATLSDSTPTGSNEPSDPAECADKMSRFNLTAAVRPGAAPTSVHALTSA